MLCVLSAADEKDDMARAGSDTFAAIITQVDCLHELGIRNPPPPPLSPLLNRVFFCSLMWLSLPWTRCFRFVLHLSHRLERHRDI